MSAVIDVERMVNERYGQAAHNREPELKPQPRTDADFDEKLAAHGIELRATTVDTLQVNVASFVIKPASIAMSRRFRSEQKS
jgi:hypothetical protein